jgi:hypothetical protein
MGAQATPACHCRLGEARSKAASRVWPRVESNHRSQIRSLPLYPLSYGASGDRVAGGRHGSGRARGPSAWARRPFSAAADHIRGSIGVGVSQVQRSHPSTPYAHDAACHVDRPAAAASTVGNAKWYAPSSPTTIGLREGRPTFSASRGRAGPKAAVGLEPRLAPRARTPRPCRAARATRRASLRTCARTH